MSIQIIPVFVVRNTGEFGALPGKSNIIGFATDEAKGKLLASGKGWWGGNAEVCHQWGLKLATGQVFLLEDKEPIDIDGKIAEAEAQLKAAALAKLSPIERKALGL